MPTVTLRFTLPDEQGEFDAARLGREALSTLWEIDQHCRSRVKYGEPTPAERELAEEIRRMIPEELLEH
jgi:glutamate-1-semialdehyde aminotransferase